MATRHALYLHLRCISSSSAAAAAGIVRHPSRPLNFNGSPPSLLRVSSQLQPSLFSSSRPFCFSLKRCFSSPSGSSNIVQIGSAEQFNTIRDKVQDEKGNAIFYFTAVWCGPCRFMTPILEETSKKFSNVATYKIDIDQEGFGSILNKLKIYSVPTFHLFQSGKKAAEIVGADATQLKNITEDLFKHE